MADQWAVGKLVVVNMPGSWAHSQAGVYLGKAYQFEDQRGIDGLKAVAVYLVRVLDLQGKEVIIVLDNSSFIGMKKGE